LFFGPSSEGVETSCALGDVCAVVVVLLVDELGVVDAVGVLLLVDELGVVDAVGVLLLVDELGVVLLVDEVGAVVLLVVGAGLGGKRIPNKDAISTIGDIISTRGDEVSVLRLGQGFEFLFVGGKSQLSCLTGFSVELEDG
jgi:hypothetical protein